ncbi:MAG: SDR family oxidoreductase [Gammaproteobacteria bacterium]|nr:SDR family oxidoreductase [Gammaproteobacteria bacterium]
MTSLCQGRTAIVTGAGGGLGRSYANALAAAGANVIVNDINAETGAETVTQIRDAGGVAEINVNDITSHEDAGRIVQQAIQSFGDCQIVVNNAGVCRDRMFASMSPEDWDQVMSVHLKGHFCISSHLARLWRSQSKDGKAVSGRIINTSSGAGLLGSIGQSNYSAAKGGILSLTLVQAAELARYGVTANALAPQARTGMTEDVFGEMMKVPDDGSFDVYHPDNAAPLVVWLASEASSHVTGRCFEIFGGKLSIADGWRSGPMRDKAARWDADELTDAVNDLLGQAEPSQPVYGSS